jgi:hypothetical protein
MGLTDDQLTRLRPEELLAYRVASDLISRRQAVGVNTTCVLVMAIERLLTGPAQCPDGGTCHHRCADGGCFRVETCGPLSGVYPGDRWPEAVVAAHTSDAFDRMLRLAADDETLDQALAALKKIADRLSITPQTYQAQNIAGVGQVILDALETRLSGAPACACANLAGDCDGHGHIPVPVLEALASAWEDQAERASADAGARAASVGPASVDERSKASERAAVLATCARMVREAITHGGQG